MKRVHFIGIAGSGLSAIARLLIESGEYAVSGSDRAASDLTRALTAAGATIFTGHDAAHIAGADLVVRSSAIPDTNPEVVAARQADIPVLKRSDFLGRLMRERTGIAVAGTHGKTTTTAMIAWMLTRCNLDPSYIIGGVSKDLGVNAHAGQGRTFVIEADEYDRMFLGLLPDITVITNLEHDHPDLFPTPADYRRAFVEFAHVLKPGGLLITCLDDPAAASLAGEVLPGRKSTTYGLDPRSEYTATAITTDDQGCHAFEAVHQARGYAASSLCRVQLSIPGRHNVLNALAALAVAHRLQVPLSTAAAALAGFSGISRRFDLRGETAGVAVLDDYAHHPTQIRATLAAARARYPGHRLWAVWQPHTFSRTQALLADYAAAFGDADAVLVTEVYAAREAPTGFSAAEVVAAMTHSEVRFTPGLAEATQVLLANVRAGDVVLVLSAGDADQIGRDVLAALQQREAAHD